LAGWGNILQIESTASVDFTKLTFSSTGIQILMRKSSWDPNSYAPEVRRASQQVANAALQGAQEENATPLRQCLCLWARESLHG